MHLKTPFLCSYHYDTCFLLIPLYHSLKNCYQMTNTGNGALHIDTGSGDY